MPRQQHRNISAQDRTRWTSSVLSSSPNNQPIPEMRTYRRDGSRGKWKHKHRCGTLPCITCLQLQYANDDIVGPAISSWLWPGGIVKRSLKGMGQGGFAAGHCSACNKPYERFQCRWPTMSSQSYGRYRVVRKAWFLVHHGVLDWSGS